MMAYAAFISYSHTADDRFAEGLQKALHQFAKPWYKIRALHVFRDQTNLSANPALWKSIEQALRDSSYFLLLASPEAAGSKWVRREIEFWRDNKSAHTLLLVLTQGDLIWDANRGDFDWERTNAIPRLLGSFFTEEPLWVDFRNAKAQEQLSLRSAPFRTRVADLAAPLHGRSKEELDGEDLREHRRTLRVAGLAVAGLVILLCAALVAAWIANEQRKLKDRQRQIAVSRLLTAESEATLGPGPDMESRERSGILALEALRRFARMGMRSLEADQALRNALGILGPSALQFDFGWPVSDVAFTRNGETLVAASVYSGPKRWRLSDRSPLPTWQRTQRVRQVALSPDGRYLVTADYHPSGLQAWVEPVDSSRPEPPRKYMGQEPVAVSPSAGYLVLGSTAGNEVRIIDLSSGQTVKTIPFGHQLVFSRDGRYLAAAAIRDTSVWKLDSGGPAERFQPVTLFRSPPGALAFSADSRYLAIKERDDDQVLILELSEGHEIARLPAMGDPGRAMALSSGARYLAMARLNDVLVRHVPTAASVLLPYGREISSLSFDTASTRLAVAGLDHRVIGWEISGLAEEMRIGPGGSVEAMRVSGSPPVLTVLAREQSPAGAGVLVTKVYSLDRGGKPVRGSVEHGRGPVALSGNGRFAAGFVDGTIRIWRVDTGREEPAIPQSGAVSVVAISDDGRYIAIRDPQGIRVLDRESRAAVSELKSDATQIAVTLGPKAWYAAGAITRVIGEGTRGRRVETIRHVWDLHQGREIVNLAFNERDSSAILIDPTGSYLAWDRTVGKDVATGARESSSGGLRPLGAESWEFPYAGAIVAFSPDGEYFVTRADDGGFRVWDIAGRREISRLPKGSSGRVAALSDDARYLAVSDGEVIRVWPLTPSGLISQGCRMLTRKKFGAVLWQRFWDTDPEEATCNQ